MRKIADISAFIFICSVAILSVVSIFGVWDVFGTDVIEKSFKTMGLLAVFSVIIMIAEKFVGHDESAQSEIVAPHDVSMFTTTRLTTVVVLIISTSFLALIGVLSIWEVFSSTVVWKSLSSLGIIAFSSCVIAIFCLKRENHPILKSGLFKMSGLSLFISAIVMVWLVTVFFGMIF